MFTRGHIYLRHDLHELFDGQRQSGISTPADHNMIFLFAAPSGEEYGYTDGWTDGGIYLYTGEGQLGDMEFIRGNAAIRDHLKHGKELHLFESTQKAHVRYVGQMECRGYREREGPDRHGHVRKVIVFELAPV